MIVIENEFDLEETVYLKTDPQQLPRIITAFKVYKKGEIMYDVVSGTLSSPHYPFELSREVNVLIKID